MLILWAVMTFEFCSKLINFSWFLVARAVTRMTKLIILWSEKRWVGQWKTKSQEQFPWLALLQSGVQSVQFSSVAQSCPTLCDPMNHSRPGLPVNQQLPEFTKTHFHWVGDAIQLSHPLSSLYSPAPNSSQHQSLFQWVNSLHEVAKVLEFQL